MMVKLLLAVYVNADFTVSYASKSNLRGFCDKN